MNIGAVVKVKGYPNPKLKLTEKIKAEYVQLAYDNRYIIIKHNSYGTHWDEVAKVVDKAIGRVFIEALAQTVEDANKLKKLQESMVGFWKKVEEYDVVLDEDTDEKN